MATRVLPPTPLLADMSAENVIFLNGTPLLADMSAENVIFLNGLLYK